jgi:hypothetical protein
LEHDAASKDGLMRHAFAFQTGSWQVRHRKLRERLASCDDWYNFEGRCEAWEMLDGAANVDDHAIGDPEGPYAAATVRRLESDGRWSIWWMDGRRDGLDPPMRGSFENGTGTFFGKDVFRGRPIDVRFVWSRTQEPSPRWEQAFSHDGGRSWETNWIMDFEREPVSGDSS